MNAELGLGEDDYDELGDDDDGSLSDDLDDDDGELASISQFVFTATWPRKKKQLSVSRLVSRL